MAVFTLHTHDGQVIVRDQDGKAIHRETCDQKIKAGANSDDFVNAIWHKLPGKVLAINHDKDVITVETQSDSVTAIVDYENNAEEFWDAFRERVASLADSILARNCNELNRTGEVTCATAEDAMELYRFVSQLPGWGIGPEYAKNPIVFSGDEA